MARVPGSSPPLEAGASAPTLPPKAPPEIAHYFPIWNPSGKVVKSDAVEEPKPSGSVREEG